MPKPVPLPFLRGFPAPVAREQCATAFRQVGSIRVGVDGAGDDLAVSIELTHADGTVLTAQLSDGAMGRLADILATQMNIVGLAPMMASATVQ